MKIHLLIAVAAALPFAGCSDPGRQGSADAAPSAGADVVFSDVTTAAGIQFEHHNGRSGKKYLPETLGSGCAFFDYNGDNWPDILLINSRSFETTPGRSTSVALYRNNKDGTFSDVTSEAGLDAEIFGLGTAIADYDNDGDPDIYITALGEDRLYRNDGKGRFQDVTLASGIENKDFGTSAAWFDYDNDGRLDLFVANYVKWSPEEDLWCSLDGETKSYCTPESYTGVSSRLFRNLGDGRFEDVTRPAGLFDETSKALGVVVFDYDRDGRLDLFVANDTQPNKLYHNEHGGTFREVGLAAGVAFGEDGRARGAMGVDAADYDRSGRPHLVVGNFSNEMINLYHNEGKGLFIDDAPRSAVGRASLLALTFGAFFFDYDLDGHLDIFAANGHLDPEIERVQPKVTFAQPPLLFRNRGDGKFEPVTEKAGQDLAKPLVARGAAYADYDRDGDLDILVTTNNGPAHLYRNDGGNENSYLRLKLVGQASNRDAIGAEVTVRGPSGEQWSLVRTGSSYCSQSELPLTFGLAKDLSVESVAVKWPSGQLRTYSDLEPNHAYLIHEEYGLQPLP
ncbi:MAG TPA: CRTAC1 family protein [Bryobacterales bacterium]|nr:CRTAC1 family protein [Bryobacterales bacterium]